VSSSSSFGKDVAAPRASHPLTSADLAWLCIFILIGTWASFALAGVGIPGFGWLSN
jgi:hypothetical protein